MPCDFHCGSESSAGLGSELQNGETGGVVDIKRGLVELAGGGVDASTRIWQSSSSAPLLQLARRPRKLHMAEY